MCSRPKITTVEQNTEVIKAAVKADAATQKASAANRKDSKGLVSENIKTSNNGLESEILTSRKKLLGE